MKLKRLISLFCTVVFLSTAVVSPSLYVEASADMIRTVEDIEGFGTYEYLRPESGDIPEMPDVLKKRKPKHHFFERGEDHALNLRSELIMPGDTFEFPTEITREEVYISDFKGRYKELEFFSPEKYGIEITGSVDVMDYEVYEGFDGDGKPFKDSFIKTLKNNTNCPITILSTSGGEGPYHFYEDHDQRLQTTNIQYLAYAPYYHLNYQFYYGDDTEIHPELDELFWEAGELEDIKFPVGYWLSDLPYTIPVPNPSKEGTRFSGWNAYENNGIISVYNKLENVSGEYSNITVEWVPDFNERYINDETYDYVNIYNAGDLTFYTGWDGNCKTIVLDPNGGTIKGRDKWITCVNTVDRIETDDAESTVPDDADFGVDLKDFIPEKEGDTFLGWCAGESALYSTYVTYDSIAEAYRYFWEYDPYGTYSDKNTKQKLYAKWASQTEEDYERAEWKLDDNGTLYIINDRGAENWREAAKADNTLAPKVKSVVLGYKDSYPEHLVERCFEGCTSLEEITFENSLILGAYAFNGCTSLKSVTFKYDVPSDWFMWMQFFGAGKDLVIHVPDEYYENYKKALGEYAYLLEPINGQRYALSVNGIMLSDDNLTIPCGEGTAVFAPETNTLTLKDARLTESLYPHCVDILQSDGTGYPDAAIVSGLDSLTIVIEGQADVATNGNDLPGFVRAYGDLVITGTGKLKSTKEDMTLLFRDSETMDYEFYTGPGIPRITALSNLTINNITAERLYADVSKNLILNKTKLFGGQIIADGDITATNISVKMFNAPDDDRMHTTELPAISSRGKSSCYTNCDLEDILLSAGDNSLSLTFDNCNIMPAYQIYGSSSTQLNIINTNISYFNEKVSVTNIPVQNITLTDCQLIEGNWTEPGEFKVQAAYNTSYGDVNGDGKVTAKDSMTVQRYAIKLVELTDDQLKAADVDNDGKVTAKDALYILRCSINLAVLPIE